MSSLKVRIGAGGPVIAEWDATGWRLIVRGQLHASGVGLDGLHVALRALALSDPDLARVVYGVVMNCAGTWEDEYTEEHGEDALTFHDWKERVETGLDTWVDLDGQLQYSA